MTAGKVSTSSGNAQYRKIQLPMKQSLTQINKKGFNLICPCFIGSEPVSHYVKSKRGVVVYKNPRYHPLLATTNLCHCDFVRKARETFDKGEEKCLPKICSENSEDALTWHFFGLLLDMPSDVKQMLITKVLEKALQRKIEQDVCCMLGNAELLFWHGREVEPFFEPPESRPSKEGRTEVDLAILAYPEALIFIEAKNRSKVVMKTTHDQKRDQIIRNIDVGTHFAVTNGYARFYFILVTRADAKQSVDCLNCYRNNPENILRTLHYRKDLAPRISELAKNLGWISWDQLF